MLLFCDVETTGLNPVKDCVIDIALIEVQPETGEIVRTFNSLVAPIYKVSEAAAKVNGYTPEKWANAPRMENVKQEIIDLFFSDGQPQKVTLAGWNIWFDQGFIVSWNWFPARITVNYHPFDILPLTFFHCGCKKVPLKDAYNAVCGTGKTEWHSAYTDTIACVEIYQKLLRRYQSGV